MIICQYNTEASKNGSPFNYISTNKFKTTTELEAHRVIKKWNDRGRIKSKKVDIIWRYNFVLQRPATLEDIDNKDIPYHTESNC